MSRPNTPREMQVEQVPRQKICVSLPELTIDQLWGVLDRQDGLTRDELVERALRYYFRALCEVEDGGEITVRHRSGHLEEMMPC